MHAFEPDVFVGDLFGRDHRTSSAPRDRTTEQQDDAQRNANNPRGDLIRREGNPADDHGDAE